MPTPALSVAGTSSVDEVSTGNKDPSLPNRDFRFSNNFLFSGPRSAPRPLLSLLPFLLPVPSCKPGSGRGGFRLAGTGSLALENSNSSSFSTKPWYMTDRRKERALWRRSRREDLLDVMSGSRDARENEELLTRQEPERRVLLLRLLK
jgi:hypothetical protein